MVVENCQTSSVRQRCIALLGIINLRDIFDTDYLVAYLQAIVDYEENAARRHNPDIGLKSDLKACDVPEAARFLERHLSPSYNCDRFDSYSTNHVNVVYVTKGQNGDGNELQLGHLMVQVPQ